MPPRSAAPQGFVCLAAPSPCTREFFRSERQISMKEQSRVNNKFLRRPQAWTLLTLPAFLAALLALGIFRVGKWLVVEDRAEPGRAIVVLSGHLPFRAMEAARLYQRGLAPEVWLTRGRRPAEEAALARLGDRKSTRLNSSH